MKNLSLLVRRPYLPSCSPEVHCRYRLLVHRAVKKSTGEVGLPLIRARITLYQKGKACHIDLDGPDRFCDGSDKLQTRDKLSRAMSVCVL